MSSTLNSAKNVAELTALADATVGRWCLGKVTTTFRENTEKGDAKDSERLLVYLPGMMFDGDESVAEIKPVLRKHVSEAMFVSYGYWRFIPKDVLKGTAEAIGKPRKGRRKIVFVGASMGGKLAADLISVLRNEYGWMGSSISEPDIELIMVDTPHDPETFKDPGRQTSQVLRWLPAGPIASLAAAPVMSQLLVAPMEWNIESGLDIALVQKRAVCRMAMFRLSAICDQQRYLADRRIEQYLALKDIPVTYVSCVRDNVTLKPLTYSGDGRSMGRENITVTQPFSRNEFVRLLEDFSGPLTLIDVDSTHVGFSERPATWTKAFEEILSKNA